MIVQILEFLLGLLLAAVTLRDVFDTVVVPGGSHSLLKVARRTVFMILPAWRAVRGRRRGISTGFAPFALVVSFAVWMLLLVTAFGLMLHALRLQFEPAIPSFAIALYAAGNGIVTMGFTDAQPHGLARWVLLASGFCGLAVITMAVTYLLEVQRSIAQRDSGIMKLTTASGDPPSGLGLLERYAGLGFLEHIPDVLQGGRDWCAGVLQSHASHPSLIYFRSTGTGAGWPAALGALMDFALIVELLVDEPRWRGAATLLREEGSQMARTLTEVAGLASQPRPASDADFIAMIARLKAAGFAVRATADLESFNAERERVAGCMAAMSEHLGTAEAPLVAPELGRKTHETA